MARASAPKTTIRFRMVVLGAPSWRGEPQAHQPAHQLVGEVRALRELSLNGMPGLGGVSPCVKTVGCLRGSRAAHGFAITNAACAGSITHEVRYLCPARDR